MLGRREEVAVAPPHLLGLWPTHSSMSRWSTPLLAQAEMKLCRRTWQPRSTSHLPPASVRLKWSWASSLVSPPGPGRSRRTFTVASRPLRLEARLFSPLCPVVRLRFLLRATTPGVAEQVLARRGGRRASPQHLGQERGQRHAPGRPLLCGPLLLADQHACSPSKSTSATCDAQQLAPPAPRCGRRRRTAGRSTGGRRSP